jgi:hypothetical protein
MEDILEQRGTDERRMGQSTHDEDGPPNKAVCQPLESATDPPMTTGSCAETSISDPSCSQRVPTLLLPLVPSVLRGRLQTICLQRRLCVDVTTPAPA